jgi:hypothetical protein
MFDMSRRRNLTDKELEEIASKLVLKQHRDDEVYSSEVSDDEDEGVLDDKGGLSDYPKDNEEIQENEEFSENEQPDADNNPGCTTYNFDWKFEPNWITEVFVFDKGNSGCKVDEMNGIFSSIIYKQTLLSL